MNWWLKLKRNLRNKLALFLSVFLLSCTTTYDGEVLITSIPVGCEKAWINFYKCEIDKQWYQIFKECEIENCDETN